MMLRLLFASDYDLRKNTSSLWFLALIQEPREPIMHSILFLINLINFHVISCADNFTDWRSSVNMSEFPADV
jgi:hypothetical protein